MNYTDLAVRPIDATTGKTFIREHHYSRGCHNGPMCWGLFFGDTLVGVCAFATPCSENVRASVFGVEHKDSVTELHRLAIAPGHARTTEGNPVASWFVARAIKGLKAKKPHIVAVLSFADTTEGHEGTVYRALNFMFCGTQDKKSMFYRDGTGRLRHPRQCGVNISRKEAIARGWTCELRGGKRRYLLLVPKGHEQKALARMCRLSPTVLT